MAISTFLINLITPFTLSFVSVPTADINLPKLIDNHSAKSIKQEYIEEVSVLASWYGPGFYGNLTASGEVFTGNDLTVAHPYYPFDTLLEISYGDKTVIARVNDRGPFKFVKGEYFTQERGIDLSEAVAKELGFDGVDTVTIRRLN